MQYMKNITLNLFYLANHRQIKCTLISEIDNNGLLLPENTEEVIIKGISTRDFNVIFADYFNKQVKLLTSTPKILYISLWFVVNVLQLNDTNYAVLEIIKEPENGDEVESRITFIRTGECFKFLSEQSLSLDKVKSADASMTEFSNNRVLCSFEGSNKFDLFEINESKIKQESRQTETPIRFTTVLPFKSSEIVMASFADNSLIGLKIDNLEAVIKMNISAGRLLWLPEMELLVVEVLPMHSESENWNMFSQLEMYRFSKDNHSMEKVDLKIHSEKKIKIESLAVFGANHLMIFNQVCKGLQVFRIDYE